ncbi:hypothetical protein NUT44_00060 [Staphylococcus haemolyticus]|uniref:hypothetical protein n=1 Tax=Staphylococcus haemolyticus TaxID=1283 RepID=UPI002482FC2E|nr:hypothetical protein [Staphylococcus haemolyticus]UUY82051.2 hypothetical protein NUT44_00060 [Staphylococcus haemolyticus]
MSDFEEGAIEPKAVKKIKFNKNSCVMMNGNLNFIIASSQRNKENLSLRKTIHSFMLGRVEIMQKIKHLNKSKIKSNSVDVYVKNAEGKIKSKSMGEILAISIN